MKITIGPMGGIAPKMAAHLLPDGAAQIASNVRLTSGALRAINTPSKSSDPIVAAAMSIYSLGPIGASVLLSWAADTDVAQSPTADNEYRIYYTNGTAPKKTNLALASSGAGPFPTAEYNWGVPAPTAAMTAAATTGTTLPAPNTWVYVYTYVTQFGATLLEESAPSPPVSITTAAGANQAVALTGIASPAVMTGYNYVYKRIYRTTGTTFQLVAQIPMGNTSFTDNLSATAIPGDALATTGWLPPPADLQGVVSMPSGVMAGFRNNEIWFSEPGFPHAWPAKYMQAFGSKIVAIKAFGNNIGVATQSNPYIGSGVYPDSFTFTKIPRNEPCVSKRSMAGDEYGAVYASPNGLVSLGLDGDSVATSDILTRLEFNKYYPETMLGVVFERRYYGFYDTGVNQAAIVFDRAEKNGMQELGFGARATTIENLSGRMIYVEKSTNYVYTYDPVGTVPMTYTWKSKLYYTPAPLNFGYAQVVCREDSATDTAYANAVIAANAAIDAANASVFAGGALHSALNDYTALGGMMLNGSELAPKIPFVEDTVTLYVYAASELKYSKAMRPNTVYTLPSGFKALGWEFQIIGQREVAGIEVANSIRELRGS